MNKKCSRLEEGIRGKATDIYNLRLILKEDSATNEL